MLTKASNGYQRSPLVPNFIGKVMQKQWLSQKLGIVGARKQEISTAAFKDHPLKSSFRGPRSPWQPSPRLMDKEKDKCFRKKKFYKEAFGLIKEYM